MENIILEIYKDKVIDRSELDIDGNVVEIIAKEVRKTKDKNNDNPIILTETNYRNMLQDPEIRSIFHSRYIKKVKEFEYFKSILFLLPVIESGYNFGQFRIASHLVSLGIPREKIHFFPLYIKNNKYQFDKEKFINTLIDLKPQFIGETVYIGWEKEIYKINKLIRNYIDTKILIGGPLTSSHLAFCLNNMDADVVTVGHGEYLLEEYFREVGKQESFTPVLDINNVFYKRGKIGENIPYANKYLDLLYWDVPILTELCKIVPVINLFTSDVCYGNCVFCYRTNPLECRFMSQEKLIERVEEIVNCIPLKELSVKYLRFYDDDFFAAAERKTDFLRRLGNIIKGKLKLFELQCSIRSIGKNNMDELANLINELEIQRVTIGVDGFNDEDLRFLQKGYDMKKVFNTLTELSSRGVSCLAYCILTTFSTNCNTLNESLMNMIKLIFLKNVYIGPTITPIISVASNNKKLYPQITGESFIFLKIDSVKDYLNIGDNPQNIIMQAGLLPKDRIVREFIEINNSFSVMQSAYIIPILADFYRLLGAEYNWLVKAKRNINKELLLLRKEEKILRESEKLIERKLYSGKKYQEIADNINSLNTVKRNIYDNLDKQNIVSESTTINNKIKQIEKILLKFVKFFDTFFDKKNALLISDELHLSVNRLLPVPIIAFDSELENKNDEIRMMYSHILEIDFLITDEEEILFY